MIEKDSVSTTRTQDMIVDARCDQCDTRLEPVFGEYPTKYAQFNGAATLTLDGGGYGEFLDLHVFELLLCAACAERTLQTLFPTQHEEFFPPQPTPESN